MDQPTNSKIRNWAMGCHLISLLMFLGIPLGNLLGPLIFWLCLRKEHPLVDEHGKESLNFQISITIYLLISVFLMFVLIGFLLIAAILVFDLVCVIIAAVKVNDDKPYKYPLTLRLIK